MFVFVVVSNGATSIYICFLFVAISNSLIGILVLGQRGQVDLIDFQSMPDGNFKFFLNYIDHGIKFLISIPIVAKRASCIAQVLLTIFTLIGPPKILQSDNGGEFEQSE